MALELTVSGVDAGYGAVCALHGVSLNISQGQTVALLVYAGYVFKRREKTFADII